MPTFVISNYLSISMGCLSFPLWVKIFLVLHKLGNFRLNLRQFGHCYETLGLGLNPVENVDIFGFMGKVTDWIQVINSQLTYVVYDSNISSVFKAFTIIWNCLICVPPCAEDLGNGQSVSSTQSRWYVDEDQKHVFPVRRWAQDLINNSMMSTS